MADTKLKYWYDWEIFGPDGKLLVHLVDLRRPSPPVDEKKLSDIDYLCERIKKYPDATLMDDNVKYVLTMLRQKSYKSEDAAEEWKQVCKAVYGDGRGRKDQDALEELRKMIHEDINFFRTILERKRKVQISVRNLIKDFMRDSKGFIPARRLRELNNYETVYYEYSKTYKKLKSVQLTDPEIFCFVEKAASCIDKPNATIDVHPNNRLLTFVKSKTWYTKGEYMYLEVDGKAVRIS